MSDLTPQSISDSAHPMTTATSQEIRANALACICALLADEGEESASHISVEAMQLVSDLRSAALADVPPMDLVRFFDDTAESAPVADDSHLDQLDIPLKIRQGFHGGDIESLYGIPNLVLLPYDMRTSTFIIVARCSEGPCVVLWNYWNYRCWLLITAKKLLLSETAASGTVFSGLHLDRILHALSLPTRRKSLGIKAQPALYLFMEHIGHHLWHELTPIFLFPAVVADAGSPPAAVENAQRLISATRPNQAAEIPVYDVTGADFIASDQLALSFNMVPSILMRVSRRTSEIFLVTIEERIRLAPPPFLSDPQEFTPDIRGCKDSDAIIFSLRWGNRMLTTTESFFVSLQSILLEQTAIRKIYITGINSDFGKYAFERFVVGSPLEQELRIANALCGLAHAPMQVINLVGAPLIDDLTAAVCSRAVIGPWGGALAKYCWALRMPVIFFSNSEMISDESNERGIYHSPSFVEDPSHASWVSDVPIIDEPSSLSWLPNARANFSMDSDQLAASVVKHMLAISE